MGTANTKLKPHTGNDYHLLRKWQNIIRKHPMSTQLKFGALRYCDLRPVKGNPVHLIKTGEHAKYTGLMQCGSMWSCPLCTPRRLRIHAAKISAIITHQKTLGNLAFMITLTFPHQYSDPASTLINRLYKAKRAFRSQKTVIKTCREIEWAGSISSVECTYSSFNGYHFHIHWLVFVPKKNWHMVEHFAEVCRKYWLYTYYRLFPTATRARNEASALEHSVYLSKNKDGSVKIAQTGDYVCGWGMEDELCKTSNKNNSSKSSKSCQMFELLESDNPRDHEVFEEYALATKGHSRICYSRNLQKGINFSEAINQYFEHIEKKTHARSKPSGTKTVCSFTHTNWNNIVRDEFFKKIPHLQNLLDIVTAGGDFFQINDYLTKHHLPLASPPVVKYIRPWEKSKAG